MKNYLKFPLPTTASWFRLPERVKALEDSSFNASDYYLADFTNTGIDPFVKTSDLPPYKVYTALLTQSGTSAPVATVLENTIGAITLIYVGPGYYYVRSNNLFVLGKTTAEIENFKCHTYWCSKNTVDQEDVDNIALISVDNSSDSNTNGRLNSTKIEIRVYN